MRPILEMLERADTWTGQALRDEITQRFDLTPEDQQAALPSGRGTQLYSRTQWAITYLSQAQLAAKVRRGVYAITPAGRAFLESAPQRITIGALQQFPTFRDSSGDRGDQLTRLAMMNHQRPRRNAPQASTRWNSWPTLFGPFVSLCWTSSSSASDSNARHFLSTSACGCSKRWVTARAP